MHNVSVNPSLKIAFTTKYAGLQHGSYPVAQCTKNQKSVWPPTHSGIKDREEKEMERRKFLFKKGR